MADGCITAKALDYSLKNWPTLTRNLLDGEVSVDNNSLENLIRPWALGRKAWLFASSELAGQRAAVVMSLVQSAKLQGHDPWACITDVLTRLPTHLSSRIDDAASPQLASPTLSAPSLSQPISTGKVGRRDAYTISARLASASRRAAVGDAGRASRLWRGTAIRRAVDPK